MTMTEEVAKVRKTRRTPAELEAFHLAAAKQVKDKIHVKHKLALMALAGDLKGIATARADKALETNAAGILAIANAIPVQIPQ